MLVAQSKIKNIVSRSISPPSHVLFADDVMIFIQANGKSLCALMSFMEEYAHNSGQEVNKAKSLLFLGKFEAPFQNRIQKVIGNHYGDSPVHLSWRPNFYGASKI